MLNENSVLRKEFYLGESVTHCYNILLLSVHAKSLFGPTPSFLTVNNFK